MTNRLEQSYDVLERLRLPNGMYLASTGSLYQYVWLRDSYYEVRPYLYKDTHHYEETYHTILDMLRKYEWKIEHHTKHRPREMWEYIHARWDAEKLEEIDTPWGHAQHDAVGAILFGIAEGVGAGRNIIRDDEDRRIIQLVVDYLACAEYWHDPDNGMWEEHREVHSSSIGAVVAALKALKTLELASVPDWLIEKGEEALANLLPWESPTKPADLAQLSLIYPYRVVSKDMAREIVKRVEALLLRERGVLRYETDSYYSHTERRDLPGIEYVGNEAEWTFGLPWLALCYMELRDLDRAEAYIKRTEEVMMEDGSLPELYYAGTDEPNPNNPLGWSNSMYIMAKERLERQV